MGHYRWTEEDLEAYRAKRASQRGAALQEKKALTEPIKQAGRIPNKTEQRFAEEFLKPRAATGEIKNYRYEAFKFRLADKTFYTPDWHVVCADGSMELHEIKGGGPVRDDAAVKFKIAREMYPEFKWFCWQWKGGAWRNLFI